MLKADRVILETDISMSCPTVAERGLVLCLKTDGSGAAIGDTAAVADLLASPSGKAVAGLLMCDVVNVDTTRYRLNAHKDEVAIGNRVTLLRKGSVVTNEYTGTPKFGDTAYLTANGILTPTLSATGGLLATPKVGQFKSGPDEAGYVKLDVNLPVV